MMAYPATVIEVMLAAPSDLSKEVQVMADVVQAWNDGNSRVRHVVLLPQSHDRQAVPAVGLHPQSVVNNQLLDKCDILIAAFWTRLGTPTDSHGSGTAEEIDRHTRSGKPAMLYFSNAPHQPNGIDVRQLDAVRDYKARMQRTAYCGEFSSPEELRTRLTVNLAKLMNEDPCVAKLISTESANGAGRQASSPRPTVVEDDARRQQIASSVADAFANSDLAKRTQKSLVSTTTFLGWFGDRGFPSLGYYNFDLCCRTTEELRSRGYAQVTRPLREEYDIAERRRYSRRSPDV